MRTLRWFHSKRRWLHWDVCIFFSVHLSKCWLKQASLLDCWFWKSTSVNNSHNHDQLCYSPTGTSTLPFFHSFRRLRAGHIFINQWSVTSILSVWVFLRHACCVCVEKWIYLSLSTRRTVNWMFLSYIASQSSTLTWLCCLLKPAHYMQCAVKSPLMRFPCCTCQKHCSSFWGEAVDVYAHSMLPWKGSAEIRKNRVRTYFS